jgi:hypothetical protein
LAFQPGGKVEGTEGDVQPGIDSNHEWRLNEERRMYRFAELSKMITARSDGLAAREGQRPE